MSSTIGLKCEAYVRDNGRLVRAYAALMSGDRRRSPDYRALMKGDLGLMRERFRETVESLGRAGVDRLRDIVCRHADYCRRRRLYKGVANAVGHVAELVSQFVDFVGTLPDLITENRELMGSIVFWMTGLIFGFFDDFCDCPDQGIAA